MKIYAVYCIFMLFAIIINNIAWYLYCDRLNKKWYETCKNITDKFDDFLNLIEEKIKGNK